MTNASESADKMTGLIGRAKNILLTPDSEWAVIDKESATVPSLYMGYIVILAAIGPVARFVHDELFGYSAFFVTPSLTSAVSQAVVSYILALVGAYVVALIVDALAPTFQGQKNQIQALKLVAYASTASWLAQVFYIVPGLSILSIVGLYSAYLFWKGLPVMMKSPADKSLPYVAVIIVAAIVVFAVIGAVSGAVLSMTSPMSSPYGTVHIGSSDTGGGTITTANGSVDLGKVQQAANAMTQAVEHASTTPAVSSDKLKDLLPASLSGLTRTETSSVGGAQMGLNTSSAQAVYGGNGEQVTLTVSDLGAAGAMASAMGSVNADKETATSYSKVYQENGHTVSEDYNNQSRSGSYTVIVASRFSVQAQGSSVSMDDLHAAVATVDMDKLQSMAQ